MDICTLLPRLRWRPSSMKRQKIRRKRAHFHQLWTRRESDNTRHVSSVNLWSQTKLPSDWNRLSNGRCFRTWPTDFAAQVYAAHWPIFASSTITRKVTRLVHQSPTHKSAARSELNGNEGKWDYATRCNRETNYVLGYHGEKNYGAFLRHNHSVIQPEWREKTQKLISSFKFGCCLVDFRSVFKTGQSWQDTAGLRLSRLSGYDTQKSQIPLYRKLQNLTAFKGT